MRNFWIVPGIEANWRRAFASAGTWGLKADKRGRLYWAALAPNDVVLFYVSGRIKRVVGYGFIRNKFYQDTPFWPEEIETGKVKWPFKFEFDIEFLLDWDKWKDDGVPIPGGAEFTQTLIIKNLEEAKPIIQKLNPEVPKELLAEAPIRPQPTEEEIPSSDHEGIKKLILEVGKLQGFIVDKEYKMGTERLDAIWKKLEESVPTYVFEVQVGGDLYHAMGKLKHAHDIWNSRIYLVASADVLGSVNQLLAGTFHELKPIFRFIETEKIQSLHKSKRDIYQLEKELGIIP